MIGLLKRSVAAAAVLSCGVVMAEVRLQGAGASFPNPIYQRWVTEYQKANPDAKVDYQSIGSGGGIKGITEKTVHFAGSDAPMSTKELDAAGGADNIVQIPTVAGGVVPAYNVPGIEEPIKFSGPLIADIYLGKVSKWNDSAIAELNPGVSLPDLAITPAWRTDGSGTTYVFTNYLTTQSDEFTQTIGAGKQVKWPLGQGGKGNEGVAAVVSQTPGALGYIEQNYANQNKIKFGQVKNKAGQFVQSTPESVSAAGAGAVASMSGNVLKANIWDQPGEKAYPIGSFTYIIVYKDLSSVQSKEQAQALADFLWWATHAGQKLAAEMDYAPLAPEVQTRVEEALDMLTFKGEAIKPAK